MSKSNQAASLCIQWSVEICKMPYVIVEGDLEINQKQSKQQFTTSVSGLKGRYLIDKRNISWQTMECAK